MLPIRLCATLVITQSAMDSRSSDAEGATVPPIVSAKKRERRITIAKYTKITEETEMKFLQS